MVYFTTNFDGKHTEGIGAMAQYQLICYTLSKCYNAGYYFGGFRNLTHYQYFNTTPEQWDKDITTFFNLPTTKEPDAPTLPFDTLQEPLKKLIEASSDTIVSFEPNQLLAFMDQYIDEQTVLEILQQVGKNVILDDQEKYFSKEKQNVAIHIRRYTKTDCDTNPRREYFEQSKQEHYTSFIKQLDATGVDFHIYSQGQEQDFYFLNKDNVFLHIEENPLISLYHMINADILHTANSSLSYVAHLLGNHKQCFVRDTFFHKWKTNTTKI